MYFKCFKCEQSFSNINEIINHLKKTHLIHQIDDPIGCLVDSPIKCRRKYITFSGLRNHMKKCTTAFEVNGESNSTNDESDTQTIIETGNIATNNTSDEKIIFEPKSVENISTESDTQNNINVNDIVFENITESTTRISTDKFIEFLNDFLNNICHLNLKEKDTNLIFNRTIEMLRKFKYFNIECLKDKFTPHQAIEYTTSVSCSEIIKFNSSYKRNKICEAKLKYVKPEEKSIGTRWEMKKNKSSKRHIMIPRLIQCTVQYIPILKTLHSLLEKNDFRKIYFEYNTNINNALNSNNYECFNSGTVFKKNELFKQEPNSLQIQISQDDFEICNELQSKTKVHTVSAVYFSIQNLPKKHLSKVQNLYLVCLCNANDLKTKNTDSNSIWQIIVNELKILETNGIEVQEYGKLRGTLVSTVMDNLGANVGLGFAQGFTANYFCRFCETPKRICQQLTTASNCVLRTKTSYDESIRIVSESINVNYSETKGVRFCCKLSDLKYFHIIDNSTADIMHDVNEGCIPELMKEIFEYFKKDICKMKNIDEMIKYHDYGFLNKSNIPSSINIEKRSLGQNASQSICLLRHLPFIFNEYRNTEKAKTIWKCVGSLLRICEIIYSDEICESDIQRLEQEIEIYLETFMSFSKRHLIPKQHFLLHYPWIIRRMGPLSWYNMIRYEAKHSALKTLRRATRNFKSINRSLAIKHQKLLSSRSFSYNDHIEAGKLSVYLNTDDSNDLLRANFGVEKEIFTTKVLNYNSFKYRKNLLIIQEPYFYKIDSIFCVENKFYLKCKRFIVLELDDFLNSIKIIEDCLHENFLIAFDELKIKKVYEVKSIASEYYVICESLEIRKILH